jgi:hypothetical protein
VPFSEGVNDVAASIAESTIAERGAAQGLPILKNGREIERSFLARDKRKAERGFL